MRSILGLQIPTQTESPLMSIAQIAETLQRIRSQAAQRKSQEQSSLLQLQREPIQEQLLKSQIAESLQRGTSLESQRKAQERALALREQREPIQEQLLKSQIALNIARRTPSQQGKIIQTPTGYYNYNPITGKSEQITDESGKPLFPIRATGPLTQMLQGTIGPEGFEASQQPQPSMGLQTAGMPNMPIVSRETPIAQQSNLIRSLASPTSSRSTSGSTFIDPNTNNAISVPTTPEVSRLQNQLNAESMIIPSIKSLYKNISPELHGVLGGLSRFTQKYVGIPDENFLNYHAAIKSDIPVIADLLVKSTGVNMTEKNIEKLQEAMKPNWYETRNMYKTRLAHIISNLWLRGTKIHNILKKGISLQELPQENLLGNLTEVAKKELDKLDYDQLTNNHNIPEFKNKKEALEWYRNNLRNNPSRAAALHTEASQI